MLCVKERERLLREKEENEKKEREEAERLRLEREKREREEAERLRKIQEEQVRVSTCTRQAFLRPLSSYTCMYMCGS